MSFSDNPAGLTPKHSREIQTLRRKLVDDLCLFVLEDRHKAIDFVYQVCPRFSLAELEHLVDDLDEMYGAEGPSGDHSIYGDW